MNIICGGEEGGAVSQCRGCGGRRGMKEERISVLLREYLLRISTFLAGCRGVSSLVTRSSKLDVSELYGPKRRIYGCLRDGYFAFARKSSVNATLTSYSRAIMMIERYIGE